MRIRWVENYSEEPDWIQGRGCLLNGQNGTPGKGGQELKHLTTSCATSSKLLNITSSVFWQNTGHVNQVFVGIFSITQSTWNLICTDKKDGSYFFFPLGQCLQ